MSGGLWLAPVFLVGLFVILWVATWVEQLVAPSALVPVPLMSEAAEADHADAAPNAEVVGEAHRPAGGLGRTPA